MKSASNLGKRSGKLILYTDRGGKTRLEIQLDKETIWLSQKQLSELFRTERSVISKHLTATFKSGELAKSQYVQYLHILRLTERPIKRRFTTWTQ